MSCHTGPEIQKTHLVFFLLLSSSNIAWASFTTNSGKIKTGDTQPEERLSKLNSSVVADADGYNSDYLYDYKVDDAPVLDKIVVNAAKDNFFVYSRINQEFPIWHAPHPLPGSLWPAPRSARYADAGTLVKLDARLEFAITKADNDVLRQAVARYRRTILHLKAVSTLQSDSESESKSGGSKLQEAANRLLQRVQVVVEVDGRRYPHLHMDESYELKIDESGSASIIANQTWGALRALESFSQLVLRDSKDRLFVKAVHIQDAPRFAHRGVMIDTARHFVAKRTLLRNLDAMEMNKMNVFHWHVVDDSSFPFQSSVWPRLSARGAYDATNKVYTAQDVRQVVEYARVRGIRVVPEFDMPGHTHSWGRGYPQLLTPCSTSTSDSDSASASASASASDSASGPAMRRARTQVRRRSDVELGPMNPASNFTFKFIATLYDELLRLFPDDYFHLGGDETGKACWLSNARVAALLGSEQKGEKVFEYFMQRSYDTVQRVAKKHKRNISFLQWNDGLSSGLKPPNGTIVQIWNSWQPDAQQCFRLGYQVIYNACWFLDEYKARVSWIPFYKCDSTFSNASISGNKLFVGGEAVMWTEYVDDRSILTKTWPLASATAERLWSWHEADIAEAAPRLEEQRCRMAIRGIDVGVASGSGSCADFSDRSPIDFDKGSENIERSELDRKILGLGFPSGADLVVLRYFCFLLALTSLFIVLFFTVKLDVFNLIRFLALSNKRLYSFTKS